ncbi:hypothetical protein LJA01_27520 [Lactobacillus japonicus]|nr:hypothetical protein LJA01_27520 [Lactobacillus japonicus]
MILQLMGQPQDNYDIVRDDSRYAIDASKLRTELEWYATHRSWWETSKAQVEQAYARHNQ